MSESHEDYSFWQGTRVDGRMSGTGLDDGDEMPPSGGPVYNDMMFVTLQSIGIAILVLMVCGTIGIYALWFSHVIDPAQAGTDAGHAFGAWLAAR